MTETSLEEDSDLNEYADQVEKVQEMIDDGFDITDEEVASQFSHYAQYDVTGEQAQNAVLTKLAKKEGVNKSTLIDASASSESQLKPMSDFDDGVWGDLKATVVDVWETKSDVVAQKGRLDDGQTTRRYTVWSRGTDSIPTLEQGQAYLFESVVGSYNDEMESYEIQMNKSSSVEAIDEELETSRGEIEFTGAFITDTNKSGFILRDAETNDLVTTSNYEGETKYDLRLILALDNGEEVYKATFDKELTEELTGMTIDEAQEIAMDAMDRTQVIKEMLPELVGRYITVRGNQQREYIYVDEYEWDNQFDVQKAEELLMRAQGM